MMNPAFSRAASAYQSTGIETSVHGASPHQLIVLLFDALQQALAAAHAAMLRKDIPTKAKQIVRAVRLLEEGLKAGLDMERGGEVARNLRTLYDYCTQRLTQANLHNDAVAIEEVQRLVAPVADAWRQIGPQAQVQAQVQARRGAGDTAATPVPTAPGSSSPAQAGAVRPSANPYAARLGAYAAAA